MYLLYERGGFFVATRNFVQHSERRHSNDQRRIARTYEGQRNARGRNTAADHQRVDKRLQPVCERDSAGEQKRKKVAGLRRRFNSAINKKGKRGE